MGRHVKYEIRLAGQTLTTIEDTLGGGCFGTVLRTDAINAAIYDYDCKADAYWIDEDGEKKWVTRHIKTFLPENYALIEIKTRPSLGYRKYRLYSKSKHRVITNLRYDTTTGKTLAYTCHREDGRDISDGDTVKCYDNPSDALLHDIA